MTMSGIVKSSRFGLIAAAFAAIMMIAGGASNASAASKGNPFPKLKGNWKCARGGCWVRPVGGKKERVGCRVKYRVGSGGNSISQSINCRGSIKLTASASVRRKKNGRVSGSWTSYNNHSGRSSGGASGSTTSTNLFVGISSKGGGRGAMRATISGNSHRVTLYKTQAGKRHIIGVLSLRR